eukprot:14407167-Alexandrium_andersonii.AAC.1
METFVVETGADPSDLRASKRGLRVGRPLKGHSLKMRFDAWAPDQISRPRLRRWNSRRAGIREGPSNT